MSPHRDGSQAHYLDGHYYEQAYRRRRKDVRFYVEMAEEHGGPVLELGAGTGRVTRALAQSGFHVLGVDRVPAMLCHARERMESLSAAAKYRVELKKADIRRLRLDRAFPLVIAPFNVFMHLYTRRDVERALATVHRHLRTRGRFVFDVLLPDPGSLARPPAKGYRAGRIRHPKDQEHYQYAEYFDYDPFSQIQHVTMEFVHSKRPDKTFETPLTQRQFFPAELEALLHYNDFTVESHWGDFDRGPVTNESESQIIVARKRR